MSNESNQPAKKSADRIKDHYSDEELKNQIDQYKLIQDSTPEKINIVYLDDEEDALKSFKSLYRFDFNIFITSSPDEARSFIENNDIHIIVTDQRMPTTTGVEFLASIIKIYPDPIRILLTGYSDIEAIIGAINEGQIYRYMSKPYPMEEMKQLLKNAAEIFFLRKDKERLIKELAEANQQLEFMLRQKSLDL